MWPMRHGVLLSMGLALFSACGAPPPETDEAAPASWPDGTVLVVNEHPISQAEVDTIGALVSKLYPEYTRPHVRRLALTNFIFAQLAIEGRFVDSRREQGQLAKGALDLARDEHQLEGSVRASGGWRNLGFELWSSVLDAPIGEWSGPVELPGRYLVVRVLERPPLAHPEQDGWKLDILEYPYLSPDSRQREIDAALDASVLTIVDPHWNEVVPEAWKHRMSAGG